MMASTKQTKPSNGDGEFDPADVASMLDDLNVTRQSNLIALLQDVQDRCGYLPAEALKQIAATATATATATAIR